MELFNRDNLPDMYAKTLWMNPNNEYVFNQNIVEYDMQSASLSISRRFKLMPKDVIDKWERMPKDQRTKLVGLKQRDDKEFSQNIIGGILRTRKEFIETNNIKPEEIVTLHSDALMFIQKHDIVDKIHGVPFVKKNNWTSYIRYGRVEMFYNDGVVDYKGIPKQMLQQHTLGMCTYILKVFQLMEDGDTEEAFAYISKFQKQYLQGKLPEYFYNSFGKTGKYVSENLKLCAFIANIMLRELR